MLLLFLVFFMSLNIFFCLFIFFMRMLLFCRDLYIIGLKLVLFVVTLCRMKGKNLQIDGNFIVGWLVITFFPIIFTLLRIFGELSFQTYVLYNHFFLLFSRNIVNRLLLQCDFRRETLYLWLLFFRFNAFFTFYFDWSVVYLDFLHYFAKWRFWFILKEKIFYKVKFLLFSLVLFFRMRQMLCLFLGICRLLKLSWCFFMNRYLWFSICLSNNMAWNIPLQLWRLFLV